MSKRSSTKARFRLGVGGCVLSLRLLANAEESWAVGWGDNTVGQLALPFSAKYAPNGPVTVPGGVYTNVTKISAGGSHSLALGEDGTVFGWGNNSAGEAAGFVTPYPYFPAGKVKIGGKELDEIISIAAGDWFSLAVKREGTVVCWGKGRSPNNAALVTVPHHLTNVISVAAGGNCCVAVQKDGTVTGWGERRPPKGLTNIVQVAVGRGNFSPCLALTRDGNVVAWIEEVERRTSDHAFVVPPTATNVARIAAGDGHCLALRKDGLVVGWGRNRDGQATGVPTRVFPSDASGIVQLNGSVLSNVVAIAAAGVFSVALKADGDVVAWGENGSHQTDVPTGLSNIVAITAGDNFCLAITTNRAVAERFHR